VFARDENLGIAYGMGLTAERVAQQWKVSARGAGRVRARVAPPALAAQQAGEFADEITSGRGDREVSRPRHRPAGSTRTRTVSLDEGPRADSTLEALAKLRTVFAIARDVAGKATGLGSVTAGNSSQTSDGAGALIVVSERILKQFSLTPLARFVSFSVRGVPPDIMGIGPKEAIPAALKNRRPVASRIWTGSN
jgi:acetyl-CoA acyltransferase